MELWSALLFGFIGSLHCAGMCGPLVLALPGNASAWPAFLASRLSYNAGRITTYAALGALFGSVGRTLALAGVQQTLSIALGCLIIAGLFVRPSGRWGVPITRFVSWLKSALGRRLGQGGARSLYVFGALNGLLPCGLVYVACAGAAVTGGVLSGVRYMALFGLGTVPMLLGVALLGRGMPLALRLRVQGLVPVCLGLVGVMLILRGLSLGIPYLSPDLSAGGAVCPACH